MKERLQKLPLYTIEGPLFHWKNPQKSVEQPTKNHVKNCLYRTHVLKL